MRTPKRKIFHAFHSGAVVGSIRVSPTADLISIVSAVAEPKESANQRQTMAEIVPIAIRNMMCQKITSVNIMTSVPYNVKKY